MRRLVVAGLSAAMLLAGGATITVARAPTPKTGTADPRNAWSACGVRLECAQVQVPLDWALPDGRTITLSVIRYLASRPGQRIGSLFFNPGGPGSPGVELVREVGAELDAFGQGRFDVVSWDPRGTGASTSVRCFDDEASEARFWGSPSIPTTRPASRRYLRQTVAFARRCGELNGELLAHISTADTVRDLDHLRELVGDRQLTYLGFSYGTFLGQTYANMFPHRVRAMILDGIVDPVAYTESREASLANAVADADLVFDQFQSLCQSAGPARCALARQGPVAPRVERLLHRLQRAPIPAPFATPPGELTYGDLLLVLFQLLRDPSRWPQLAEDLDAAAAGDGSALETQARSERPPGTWGVAPAVAIGCADSPARQGPRAWPQVIGRLTGISRISGPFNGWRLWAPCASWPARSADRYTGPWDATTEHPILVIGTRYDPNTSFDNARRAARRLGHAVLLTHEGYGHLSTQNLSACVERARSAYLVDLVTPPLGTVCPSDWLPFDPNFGDPLP